MKHKKWTVKKDSGVPYDTFAKSSNAFNLPDISFLKLANSSPNNQHSTAGKIFSYINCAVIR